MGAAQAHSAEHCNEVCARVLDVLRQQGAAGTSTIEELLEKCGFQCEKKTRRDGRDQDLNDMIEKLFNLQDLNENGVLEESELIQLNKKVAMLHYGKDVDKEEVRAKYQELFRSKLDPSGQPVPVEKFRQYILDVLRAVDPDPNAQQMIVEQW